MRQNPAQINQAIRPGSWVTWAGHFTITVSTFATHGEVAEHTVIDQYSGHCCRGTGDNYSTAIRL